MPAPDFALLTRELFELDAGPAKETAMDTRILDAALGQIGEYGEAKLTIDAVANAARVARTTVFRRFISKDELVRRVYLREWRRAADLARDVTGEQLTVRAALTEAFAGLTVYARHHPVTRQISRAEPDLVVAMWREGEVNGLTAISSLLVAVAARCRDSGEIDRAALIVVCDTLARLMFANMLLPIDATSESDERAALVRQAAGVLSRADPSAVDRARDQPTTAA